MSNILRGEYIWIDGYGGLRSKTKIVRSKHTDKDFFKVFGIWNYDGSSTHQATTESSEVHLKPVLILPDRGRSINVPNYNLNVSDFLVLCETYVDAELTIPHPTNTRHNANNIMNLYNDQK